MKKRAGKEINPVEKTWGKFFYDLAKLTFAGLVIGGIATFDTELKESIFIYKSYRWWNSNSDIRLIGNKIFK